MGFNGFEAILWDLEGWWRVLSGFYKISKDSNGFFGIWMVFDGFEKSSLLSASSLVSCHGDTSCLKMLPDRIQIAPRSPKNMPGRPAPRLPGPNLGLKRSAKKIQIVSNCGLEAIYIANMCICNQHTFSHFFYWFLEFWTVPGASH